MVENQKLVIVLFFSIWIGIIGLGIRADMKKPMSKNAAYKLVYNTELVQSLFALENGRYRDCITSEVVRPCDTEWVTCIDEAWVVNFELSQSCVVHDGRLNVTVLVDAHNRVIKSRFPEKYYYQDPKYCIEDYECYSGEGHAINFIYGQISKFKNKGAVCKNNECILQ